MTESNTFVAQQIVSGVYSVSQRHKGKSFIWNILSDILKEDNTILDGFVYCRSCRKVLKFTGNQTSNLNRHRCCQALKQPPVLQTVSAADKQEAINTCTEWITEDCRPCSIINEPGFVNIARFFVKIGANYGENVDVNDLLPEAATISHKVQQIADQKREFMSKDIKDIVISGGAAATVDMWYDNFVKRNWLSVTLHYEKNSQLFDIMLGLKSMDFPRSTSDNILKKLNSIFNQFGIDDIKPIKFVTDGGTNIVEALENNTRLNCSSHLFANVLDKSFDETIELTEVIHVCKIIVRYLKKLNLQHKQPSSLKNPCPTRWNSNYSVLKSVVDNWSDVHEVLNENTDIKQLLHRNLAILKALIDLVKNFEIVFTKMQTCSSPSLCFVLPSISKIKSLCEANKAELPSISVLKSNIIQNIDEMWINNLTIWHKTAFFLFPPAVRMQPNDVSNIKEFCLSQIEGFEFTPAEHDLQHDITIKSEPYSSNPASPATNSDPIDIKEFCISQLRVFENGDKAPTLHETIPIKSERYSSNPTSPGTPNDAIDIKEFCISEIEVFENGASLKSEPSSPASAATSNEFNDTKEYTVSQTQSSVSQYVEPNCSNCSTGTSTNPPSPRQDIQFFFPNLLQKSVQKSKDSPWEELQKYSREKVELTEDFDVLEWWRNNLRTYPYLSKFALKVHSIPASSAAAERAFSLSGNIIEKRNILEHKSQDNLLFLHSFYKNYEK